MADGPKNEPQDVPVFNLEDTTLDTVYANSTHIVVGEGDVTLYFGFQQVDGYNIPASNVKRIVATHDSFMRMMEFWASRYRLLETLYGGKPPSLRDMDRDVIQAAFDTMLGSASNEVNSNESTNISGDKSEPTGSTSDS